MLVSPGYVPSYAILSSLGRPLFERLDSWVRAGPAVFLLQAPWPEPYGAGLGWEA